MVEIVGAWPGPRTRVHGRCGGIAAVAGVHRCVVAFLLLRVGPLWADATKVPEADARAATSAPAAPAATPSGPPPEVDAADAAWHERADEGEADVESAGATPGWSPDVGLGAQVFGVSGKAMVGLSARIGDGLFWGELEFTPIWLAQSSPDFDGSFLGNQWGFYFSLAPLRTRFVEGLLGVGLDLFHLWGVHSDEAFSALAFKAAVHARPTPSTSVFATVRSHALHSGGLELGTHRSRERTVPVLGTLGVEWRFQ